MANWQKQQGKLDHCNLTKSVLISHTSSVKSPLNSYVFNSQFPKNHLSNVTRLKITSDINEDDAFASLFVFIRG